MVTETFGKRANSRTRAIVNVLEGGEPLIDDFGYLVIGAIAYPVGYGTEAAVSAAHAVRGAMRRVFRQEPRNP